jgi:hypothetical protein
MPKILLEEAIAHFQAELNFLQHRFHNQELR